MNATTPTGVRRTPRRQWLWSVFLLAAAAVLAVAGTVETNLLDPPTPTQRATGDSALSPTLTPPAEAAASQPVSIRIPSIEVASHLVRLGLEEDRTVQVPEDPDQAGWYELGTVPGQNGSAVILGHVDSAEGPAVFHRLEELAPRDRIRVAMHDGRVEVFEVVRTETVRNADFPANKVYAGTPDRPTLTVVTCGGEYDKSKGGYQSNVIVYAELVGTAPGVDVAD